MISCTRSHALHKDVSVYVKPVVTMRLDTVRCSRRNSWSPTCEDEAEILTPHKVVFKHYALHSKQIPYIRVSEDVIHLALPGHLRSRKHGYIYVFAQHQPFSSSFTYVRNKLSNTTIAYAQHYGITSTGS